MLMKSARNNIYFIEIFGIVLELTPSSENNLRAMKMRAWYLVVHMKHSNRTIRPVILINTVIKNNTQYLSTYIKH